MTSSKTNNRRKVLIGLGGGIAGASQLPKSWTRPVVDSVMLPAHAETSEVASQFSGPLNFVEQDGSNSPLEDVLSILVPDAVAGLAPISSASMCIDTSGAPSFTAKLEVEFGGSITDYYEASGTIGGPALNFSYMGCFGSQSRVQIEVTSVSSAGAVYSVIADDPSVATAAGTLPQGTTCPQKPICKK